ncbi:hypothetical protein PUNSTDRAFT_25973, partial [Punctularia strigosozonata HHB-11173 SS5]|uniref:uncharacterized protein n=1 Tax=Punctularia strigosozonata (strain HHB-11173) TaxID=741275 RepID=UPI0004417022
LLACSLIFLYTGGSRLPRDMQLQAGLASVYHRDCVLSAGTGFGKTYAMIIAWLLRPAELGLVFSPLKRL